jgi:cytidylate kinase
MKKNGLIIAIDGPAAVGKSTMGKLIARELGFLYIDTGADFQYGFKYLYNYRESEQKEPK